MGSVFKESVININYTISSLKSVMMMDGFSILLLGCVMSLTLFRYDATWSDSESQMAWCVTILGLVAIGVMVLKKQIVRWSSLDVLVGLYSLYLLANAIYVSHYPLAHQMIMMGQCVVLYVFIRVTTISGKGIERMMVYFMAIAGVYESMVAMIQLGELVSADIMQMTGTFRNPGPLGIYIAVMASPCTCYYLRTREKFIGFALVVMLMAMSATWSRTAWLAYSIVLFFLFRTYVIRHWKLVLSLIIGTMTILYFIKQESADSRSLMDIISFNEWTLNPVWGCGVGGYVQALAHGQMDYFLNHVNSDFVACVGTTNMAFNEYLKVLVEQGIVGFAFILSILGISLYRMLNKHSNLIYGMIALCIAALLSYPFHLYPFMLIITLFVALASGGDGYEINVSRGRRLANVVFLLIPICFSIMMNREVDRHVKITNEARNYVFMSDAAFMDDYYKYLPWKNDDREFLFKFGKMLRNEGRYNDSNAILRKETFLDTDPMVYVLMGRNYEDMNLYDEADSLYRQAFLLQPNRVYPLYRQMKLYEKIGAKPRLTQKAQEIMSFTPKIMSPAVKEIKEEAKMIVNSK